jgi:sarcosine oxidase subunit alpha
MQERLTHLKTLRVDPETPVPFTYRGKKYRGVTGDSIASALFANGIRIFSRSLKYHRPRGLYSLNGECSNCLMEVDGIPNVQAETTLLKSGMHIRPQNVVGTPDHDLMAFVDRFDQLMPSGFYYHYFHRPYKLWPFFQNRLRSAAGLGRLRPTARITGIYDELYPSTDVCVIGAGPAGIHAAIAAAAQGLRIILLEARPWAGGYFDYRASVYADNVPLFERARELSRQIGQMENIRLFRDTAVIGCYANTLVTAFQKGKESDHFDERYIEIKAASIVMATGCIERPLIFDHNDRPGIMQISCAHRLARNYGLLPGNSAVFSISDDLGIEAAIDLSDLGLHVPIVADARFEGQDENLLQEIDKRNIPFRRGWVASKAHGGRQLKGVRLCTIDGMRFQDSSCDTLIASAGLTPAAGPLFLSRAKMAYDLFTGFFLPEQLPSNIHAAGRLLGLTDHAAIETSGRLAGLKASKTCGVTLDKKIGSAVEELDNLPGPARGCKLVQAPGVGRKRFVCFDEDVTVKNIYQACNMGFDQVELAKRFSTAGLGPGQGGIPGHNLPMVIAQYQGDERHEILPSTVRPPLVPTYLATYAGKRHSMVKKTPLQDAMATQDGAVFRRAGAWERVRYFSEDTTSRSEIECVRNRVGVIDVSTLGKFRIFGPDALKALERVHVGDMASVCKGKVKYSAMCNQDGCLMDDGVITQKGENDYYFTTSTGRAAATAEWIRYHTRHDGWDFSIVNLTDAFGAINLAGPDARKVLEKLVNQDLSNDSFPFIGYREYMVHDTIPVRAIRLGFVGELSYELHVPSSYTHALWDLIIAAGRPFGIQPFGLEAQNVLRLEKGHVIIGQETEIRTTLHDLGLGFLWHRKKPDAKKIGSRALKFTEHQDGRMKLVGFKMEDATRPAKDGAVVVDSDIRGYVCTSRYSVTLKESIGLALVESELAQIGTRLALFEDNMGDQRLYARVVPTPFYDPEGKRVRM